MRYDGLVVDLKQKLVILINGQEVSHNRLPVNVGRVQVKLVSSAMVMGKAFKICTRTLQKLNYIICHIQLNLKTLRSLSSGMESTTWKCTFPMTSKSLRFHVHHRKN